MSPAVEVADRLYERWNADGLTGLVDRVDPAFELIIDPLRPVETALRGATSPLQWAAAHLWTLREGRIARWETHVDLGVARRTLDD
jgi:hypothetical protein